MTYFLAACTNDKAQLVVHTMQTNDEGTAHMVESAWRARGFIVKFWKEA